MLEVLATYKDVQRAGTLLTLTFVTVNDYLWLLRAVSQELNVLGRHCLYYLAAAVSDFFLPRQKMVRALLLLHPAPPPVPLHPMIVLSPPIAGVPSTRD